GPRLPVKPTFKAPEVSTTPPAKVLFVAVRANVPAPPVVRPVLPVIVLLIVNVVPATVPPVLIIPSVPKFTLGSVTFTAPELDAAKATDNKVNVPVPVRFVPAAPLINKAFKVCGTFKAIGAVILTTLPVVAADGSPLP